MINLMPAMALLLLALSAAKICDFYWAFNALLVIVIISSLGVEYVVLLRKEKEED